MTHPFSSHLRLSNRAAAELELILAEDPMCGGNIFAAGMQFASAPGT